MFTPGNPLNSFQKWNVGAVIRDILLSDEGIAGEVNEHIYPCIAPQDTLGDFIIYKREKYSKARTHQGIVQDDCKVSLTVISESYDEAVKIAEMIDNTLTGDHSIQDNTVRLRCELIDSTEGWEDNKYYQVLLYNIN